MGDRDLRVSQVWVPQVKVGEYITEQSYHVGGRTSGENGGIYY